jgi:hypothetical protein
MVSDINKCAERRDRDLDHALSSALSHVECATTATTGILRVNSSLPIFHSPHADSVTTRFFTGDCFIHSAPRSDGWWLVGENEWLHVRDQDSAVWLPCRSTEPALYDSLLPHVQAWGRYRRYVTDRRLSDEIRKLAHTDEDPVLGNFPHLPASPVSPAPTAPPEAPVAGSSPASPASPESPHSPAPPDSPASPGPQLDEHLVSTRSVLDEMESRRAAQSAADKSRARAEDARLEVAAIAADKLEKTNRKSQGERDRERAAHRRLLDEQTERDNHSRFLAIAREADLAIGLLALGEERGSRQGVICCGSCPCWRTAGFNR